MLVAVGVRRRDGRALQGVGDGVQEADHAAGECERGGCEALGGIWGLLILGDDSREWDLQGQGVSAAMLMKRYITEMKTVVSVSRLSIDLVQSIEPIHRPIAPVWADGQDHTQTRDCSPPHRRPAAPAWSPPVGAGPGGRAGVSPARGSVRLSISTTSVCPGQEDRFDIRVGKSVAFVSSSRLFLPLPISNLYFINPPSIIPFLLLLLLLLSVRDRLHSGWSLVSVSDLCPFFPS